jgi:nondiscriminating aspartyl-tRNA synthetase
MQQEIPSQAVPPFEAPQPVLTQRLWSSQLSQHIGERVHVSGWLHRMRQLSSVSFLILRDSKGLTQIVIEDAELVAELGKLYNESVLSVTATVVANSQAPGGIELHQPEVEVLSAATTPPPFDLFRPGLNAQLPTQLDYAALSLRHPLRRAAARIAAASMSGFRNTLQTHDFVEIQTPKIVASATESGANVFTIDYFGTPAYLAQSPQFYKQMMVGVFERVFEVGPVFRAEPHSTPRHLNEYVSMDAEFGFIENHHTVMQMLTAVLHGMLETIQTQAGDALALIQAAQPELSLPLLPTSIPVIHFAEAMELIYRETGEDARHEPDFAPSHERWLGNWVLQEYQSDFLFVEGYPMVKRPFYTHPNPAKPETSNSFDLLFRGVEMVTGGQRLHQYADYQAALARHHLPAEPFAGYLAAFEFGMPPHGGFAIGLERWVSRLLNIANIREVTLFPRDLERLTP